MTWVTPTATSLSEGRAGDEIRKSPIGSGWNFRRIDAQSWVLPLRLDEPPCGKTSIRSPEMKLASADKGSFAYRNCRFLGGHSHQILQAECHGNILPGPRIGPSARTY